MSNNPEENFSRGLPVIGHLLDYQKDRLALLTRLNEKLGDRFRLKIGPKTLTALVSPEDVRHVMQTNIKNYYKRTNFDQLFGTGLFTTNGNIWRGQRKAVQPLFGPRYIESCVPIILDSVKGRLGERANNPQKNIYDLYSRITFDIIVRTIIGIDYTHRFEELNHALSYISDYLTKANYLPLELPSWANPDKKRYEACQALLDEIIYESIAVQKAKASRKASSMVSLLLQAKEDDPSLAIDDAKIRDNIITLMFAGFETSALALSWLSCLLGTMPDLQEQLRAEVEDAPLDDMKVKDFAHYPLLDAVVNETLRLYPPGWAWTRVAQEDDDINGFKVKKGEIIFISPYLTQRSPQVWENPNAFDHTRFMGEGARPKRPFSFYPFGGGPRICVGMQFGLVEIKLILAAILKEFSIVADKVPSPTPMATLGAKEGFKAELKNRD